MNRFFLFIGVLLLCGSVQAQKDLYDLEHLVEIKLEFEESNWHYLLDSLKERGQDERLVADVSVDGTEYPQSGVRYKGNSSYFNVRNAGGRKLPFNIKVDFVNKKTRLPGGFVTLKLSNVFRDPSFMREVLSYEVARKYMPAPHANYAKVYVNDEYLGLYNLSESVDDDFLKEYYGDDNGVFFKCDPDWHNRTPTSCKTGNNASLEYLGQDSVCYYALYELKSKKGGWAELLALTEVINQYPQRLEQMMNINEVLWMLAYDNVLVNLDSYLGRLCHNYYLYQDEANIWHPVVWDMNLSFGGFRYTGLGAPLSNESMQEMSMFLHYKEDNMQRPLLVQLLKDNHFRKIYLAQIKTIVEENFSNGWYKEKAAEIQALIGDEVAADPNRLYDLALYEKNFDETVQIDNSRIIGITELMDQRASHLLSHPLMQKEQPSIAEVKHQVIGDNANITAQVEVADAVWLYHRRNADSPWQRQPMAANDNDAWMAQIPLSEDVQYYVVAENKYIAALSPARAAKEFYEIKAK
ncbi:MAG: CotH kinase family protein [Bacteroidota bacterium]